jgi:hypothetical protein
VNPPGYQYALNPDYAGITTAGSRQRQFLSRAISSWHPLKAIACHRGVWEPWNADPRKLNAAMRPILADAIDSGVSWLLQGDCHVGHVGLPRYPTAPGYDEARADGEVGVCTMSMSGGYVTRAVDDTVLADHATSVPWDSGTGASGSAMHAAIIECRGVESMHVRIHESTATDEAGSVVYEGDHKRNPGA